MTTTWTTPDLRRRLLREVAATFRWEHEDTLPTETVCDRLTSRPASYLPDVDFDADWEPHYLAAALRRLGVFTANEFWTPPYDGLRIARMGVRNLVAADDQGRRSGAPAFDEEPWEDGTRFTTDEGDQIHVYPGPSGVRMQVIGSGCAAPETELIASLTGHEVGLLIAAFSHLLESENP